MRTIKNDCSRNETNKEVLKLKKQIEYWKEMAGLSPEQREMVELSEITESRVPNDEISTRSANSTKHSTAATTTPATTK